MRKHFENIPSYHFFRRFSNAPLKNYKTFAFSKFKSNPEKQNYYNLFEKYIPEKNLTFSICFYNKYIA